MSESRIPETNIDRYLLGDLPDAEQLAIERLYFADTEMFELVWDAENELVDRYVRGRLPPRESELFERNYLQSPKHQAKVAAARDMLRGVERRAQPESMRETNAHATSGRGWFAGWLAHLTPAPGLRGALAAVLVLVLAGIGWLSIDWLRLKVALRDVRSELAQQRQAQDRIEQQLAAEQQQSGRVKAEILRLEREVLDKSASSLLRDGSRVVSLVLSPVLLRDSGSRQPEVETTTATEWIRLEMPLESSGSALYQAVVRTPEGKKVWSRRSIQSEGNTMVLEIPSRSLPSGDYIAILSAGRQGEVEEMNRYAFRIIRRRAAATLPPSPGRQVRVGSS